MTIWKFPLPLVDEPIIRMPAGARILAVQMQQGAPCLWAVVNPEAPETARRFHVAGTGEDIDPLHATCPYVATFQMHGALVFHLFDLGESP